jgi:hypothetical protein
MWKPYNKARIAIALCGFLSAIFLPWWVPVIVVIGMACFWRAWEAMLIGLTVDFLWLPVHAFPFCTFGAIAIVWLLEPVRRELLVR